VPRQGFDRFLVCFARPRLYIASQFARLPEVAAHSRARARSGRLAQRIYVGVLQPGLHYELEEISKAEILRKLEQRFDGKTIRNVRFRIGCKQSAPN
jgi:hypothetical protein